MLTIGIGAYGLKIKYNKDATTVTYREAGFLVTVLDNIKLRYYKKKLVFLGKFVAKSSDKKSCLGTLYNIIYCRTKILH